MESWKPTHHPWQLVKKRKRTHDPTEKTTHRPPTPFNSPNQFDELQRLSGDDNTSPASGLHTAANSESHKPPPIYVYDVTNYRAMTQYLTEVLEEEQ